MTDLLPLTVKDQFRELQRYESYLIEQRPNFKEYSVDLTYRVMCKNSEELIDIIRKVAPILTPS